MIDCNDSPPRVTRHLVQKDQRLVVTAQLFGAAFFPLRIEPVVYGVTQRMAPDYHGGYWDFWLLANGGFYLSPSEDRIYQVSCDNYWRGELSADALGIVACLYTYSHLSFGGPESFARACARHYHMLRQYMMEHAEVAGILGAID